MKILKLIFSIVTTILSFTIYAQTIEHPDHDFYHHEHHKNEIGIANSLAFFLKEQEFAYALHIHFVRNIQNSKFGLGLGYERIFDEHQHNTLAIVAAYNPIEELHLAVSPGLTFEGNISKLDFALHIETSYEFDLGNLHLGPAFEIAFDPEDTHLSLGLHIGYGF